MTAVRGTLGKSCPGIIFGKQVGFNTHQGKNPGHLDK